MPHPRLTVLLAGSLPFLFAACEPSSPGSPAAPTQPVSALYECRGVPGYSDINWDSLRQDLKAHPHDCSARGADTASREMSLPAGQPAQPGQSIALIVHHVILDANCRFLARSVDTVSTPAATPPRPILWDFHLPDGSLAETGEYYVNSEVGWPDGRKDTTYQKLGFINFGCGG